MSRLLIYFANPWVLWLLALLPVLTLLGIWARRRRRRALNLLASWSALRALTSVRRRRRGLRGTSFSLGLVVLIGACAGPQWGQEPAEAPEPAVAAGRDLVVLLDLSRSMLAEDVLPSRLGRAKNALTDLADTIQQSGGHRLALVVFAGQARVVCPLTPDYDHFREALANLDPPDPLLTPRSVGEAAVSGTRMGMGLRLALQVHDPRFHGHQDILMISDGDDPARDGEWRAGAADARAQGIPVYTVGVGDSDHDSPIPGKDGKPLVHAGTEVRTRLDEAPLLEIARQTGGTYIPARTSHLPLAELFRASIQPGPGRDLGEDVLPTYRQRYAWFLAAALGLLTMAMIVGDRKE